ncbi:MAG: IS4 family transposase, partial [Chloroflexi bacterium]|nr:IS4 family transposase [Chloroflexota bacterium]
MVTVGGRMFPDEILARIAEAVKADSGISRRQLSRRVSDWLGWRNPAGRLQEMSCRKAMLELHRQGLIPLPAVKGTYPFQQARPPAPPPLGAVECALEDLGAIDLVRVTQSWHSSLWRGMMAAYHYLGSGPLCGAQLRYLVRSERCGWIGGLSYSACARRVECRDAWIGWSEEARVRNRLRVVNNSRFLIPPMVKVKNLASHVLARCQARLADDWKKVYAYRPVLLETYVERGRFAATCYRAANWIRVGQTEGRGRQGTGTTIKDVYLMPLAEDWQAHLCRRPDGTVWVCPAAERPPPKDWVEAELGGANLGDRRLTARLLQITGQFYAKPTANIPQASGSATAANLTYRFLDNENVEWPKILEPHYRATEERIQEKGLVLVAQDTTTLNYSTHPNTQGLGPIGTGSEAVRGLMVHDTMAFTPQGTPLGLLDVQCWAREGIGSKQSRHQKPIEEKESWKWVESYRAVSATRNRSRQTRLVLMGDREADIHELFAEQAATPHGADLLIRAERSRNRKVMDDEEACDFLWALLEQAPVLGRREILVPPSETRAARLAVLEVRTRPVTLRPPQRKPHLPAMRLWAVFARELDVPAGVEGLEWMLLTTVAVEDKDQAYERLEWYAKRWGIEVYHRILKSGCRVEKRQLEHARRLQNCLAIDMVVAWRIHHLTCLGEETPDVVCTIYFTDSEWKALTTFVT